MLGGGDAAAGTGGTSTITVSNTWATGDTFLVTLVNVITGVAQSLGYGTVSNSTPTYVMTYRNKVNILFGSTWAFSEIGLPTSFNNLEGTGNGYITLSDAYSESDNAQAIVPYQGRLAVLSQNSIQIWQIDADPVNYQLLQILENVGTFAKLSAVAFGELDVFFLHRTGIRSLRVRDASNNAYLSDVGSPVDFLVQASLASATSTQQAAACAVMEPNRSQYWCFLYDTIYVLSYFPQMKVSAWSIFKPSYQSGSVSRTTFVNGAVPSVIIRLGYVNDATKFVKQYTVAGGGGSQTGIRPFNYLWVYTTAEVLLVSYTIPTGMMFQGTLTLDITGTTVTPVANQTAFTPQKFVVYNGQVIARAADGFYVYGGADNATYDNSICAWETSWMDAETPANTKQVKGMDAAQTGTWDYFGSIDFLGNNMEQVLDAQTTPTFLGGRIQMTLQGTHMKMRGQTNGTAARAVVSNLLFHYKGTSVK